MNDDDDGFKPLATTDNNLFLYILLFCLIFYIIYICLFVCLFVNFGMRGECVFFFTCFVYRFVWQLVVCLYLMVKIFVYIYVYYRYKKYFIFIKHFKLRSFFFSIFVIIIVCSISITRLFNTREREEKPTFKCNCCCV